MVGLTRHQPLASRSGSNRLRCEQHLDLLPHRRECARPTIVRSHPLSRELPCRPSPALSGPELGKPLVLREDGPTFAQAVRPPSQRLGDSTYGSLLYEDRIQPRMTFSKCRSADADPKSTTLSLRPQSRADPYIACNYASRPAACGL